MGGRNPRASIIAQITRLEQKREARHAAIHQEIEDEKTAVEVASRDAEYNANPAAKAFVAFIYSLGKDYNTV